MPKLPHISGVERAMAMQRLGVRQRGSHLLMRRGDSGCTVPMHKEIKVGTLAGVIKQAGISAEQFLKALEG